MITGGFMSDAGTLLVTRVINVETGAITNPVKLRARVTMLGLIGQLDEAVTELKLPAVTRTETRAEEAVNGGDAKQAGQRRLRLGSRKTPPPGRRSST
jgi:hypothetical protein